MCLSMESMLASQIAHLDIARVVYIVSPGRNRCSPRRSASGSPWTTCGDCDPVWLSCNVATRRCSPGRRLTTPTTGQLAVLRAPVWRWSGGQSVPTWQFFQKIATTLAERVHVVARADECGAGRVFSSMAQGWPAATRRVCFAPTPWQPTSAPSGRRILAEVQG